MAQVIYKRLPGDLLEETHEVPAAQSGNVGGLLHRQWSVIILFYQFKDGTQASRRILVYELGAMALPFTSKRIPQQNQDHLQVCLDCQMCPFRIHWQFRVNSLNQVKNLTGDFVWSPKNVGNERRIEGERQQVSCFFVTRVTRINH